PSWCEAHHIDFWDRDHGATDIDQGVLLCRFHHQLFHGTGWEITRSGSHYFLIPPKNLDSFQRPILMPSKTQAIRAMTDPALQALLARTRPLQIDPPVAPIGDSHRAPLGTTIIPMTPTPAGPGETAVRFVWSDTLWDDEPVPGSDG
ncbi:MAG: hypothetical protein JWQ43_1001, partial [Glaciihabitans sp.]|nr:hypothetical protein [Glaciihabitans sp.]